MLATYRLKYGGPNVSIVGEIEKPSEEDLKPGQLLIKVHGASLNPADIGQRKGGLRMIMPMTFPVIYGFDFSGVVVAKRDSNYAIGEEVFGMVKGLSCGTLAEYLIVDAEICAPKPTNISHLEAASIPLVGITSIIALRKCKLIEYALPKDRKVLILGGAGGVGSCAIQLAKGLYGATFIATTASPGKKTELCESLGADFVANYREDLVKQLEEYGPFDAVFDTVGDIKRALPLIKDGGAACSIVATKTVEGILEWLDLSGESKRATSGVESILRSKTGKAVMNRLFGATSLKNKLNKRGITYEAITASGDGEITLILAKEILEGRLTAVIDKEFPLAEGIEAIAYLESGHASGKVVINTIVE